MTPPPRRHMPRPMRQVLGDVIAGMAPEDPLSRLQAAWPDLVGRAAAEQSSPAKLRGDGAVVVRCSSGAQASELQLHGAQLQELISATLELRVELVFEGPGRRR